MMAGALLLISGLSTEALAAQVNPKSMSVLIGTYGGSIASLATPKDGKILKLYSSGRGQLNAVFNYSSSGLSSDIALTATVRQRTSSDTFIFQVRNASGAWVNIASTSGGTTSKSFKQALPVGSIVNGGVSVRLIASSSADDIDIDQLVLMDQGLSSLPLPVPVLPPPADAVPLPLPVPVIVPTPVAAPAVPVPSVPSSAKSLPPGTSWFWQLQGSINQNVAAKVYDIDLYDNSTATFSSLKQAGRLVICYFSAGTYENWRQDANQFPQAAIGSTVDGWAGENWLDVRNPVVREVMGKRMDMAKAKGCDGLEPDNVDGYSNKSGFPLTFQDQVNFNSFLADQAHARGMIIALKNSTDLVSVLVDKFDFAVVEECFKYNECGAYSPFVKQNKAVLNAEYSSFSSSICSQAASLKFSTVFFNLNLDGSVYRPCP